MLKLNPLPRLPKLALAACTLLFAAAAAALPEHPATMFQLSLSPLERVSTLPDPEAGTYAAQMPEALQDPHAGRHRVHDRHPARHTL